MKLADCPGYETNLQLTQHYKSLILEFQNRKQEPENKIKSNLLFVPCAQYSFTPATCRGLPAGSSEESF